MTVVKRYLVRGAAAVVLVVIGLLIFGIFSTIKIKDEAREGLAEIPRLPVVTMDSLPAQIAYHDANFLILVHFNSECDHCLSEIEALKDNIHSFRESKIIMVSSESISAIKEFSRSRSLDSIDNVEFLKILPDDVQIVFGSIVVPRLFIYRTSDQKLVKEFSGETKMETVLGCLK